MKQSQHAQQSAFIVRTFGFRELAQLYFPNNTPESAAKALRRLIRAYVGLPDQLVANGFVPGSRMMSPAVVEVLVKHLGEP